MPNPWFKKKFILSIVLLIFGYYLVRIETYKYVLSSTVRNAAPVEVWEYVSDFNNMKILIPNILSFSIESETSNYETWKYKVYYEEYLSQLPFFTNFAWAEYETRKLSENQYVVFSTHQTCFVTSLFCLNTNSVFEVQPAKDAPDSSTYTETIRYQCPAIFAGFCEEEIQVQRKRIKEVLDEVFKKKETSV